MTNPDNVVEGTVGDVTVSDDAPEVAQEVAPEVGENKDLNSWLPITASREAKWWYSAFHCVTAMVGAGVLGLPLVLAQLTPYVGVTAILVSWTVTLYTLWQLINLHEHWPDRRFDRFSELGQHVLGEKLGSWTVLPQQLIVQIGSNIVYMVTGGKSLQKGIELLSPEAQFRKTYYIMIFACIHLVLSQTPNFNSLKIISLTAALMSIGYSVISTGASITHIVQHHPSPDIYGLRSHKTLNTVFDVFSSFGTLAFAFAGHSVALEIQATIPSTPENPSKKSMWRGTVVAYIIVALCYFSVAISGYLAFGKFVNGDVLLSLERPFWLISVANFMVFVHVIGSYQVFAMPVFDKMESTLVTKFKFTPGRPVRLVARSVYVLLTGFIGICVPFFEGLLGFFGGLAFSITSYLIPSALWLIVHKPKRWSFHWIASWVSICIGISITSVAPIGGAFTIVTSWKSYTMFS